MSKRFSHITLFIFYLWTHNVHAQDALSLPIFEQKIFAVKYDFRDGLPSNNVLEYMSDDQHGIWLRTLNAVSYFCGTHFINFSTSSTIYKIRNYQIGGYAYHDGFVYIVGDQGVERISTLHKTVSLLWLGSKEYDFRKIYVTKSGHILLVTLKGDIFHLSGGKLQSVGSIKGGYYYFVCESSQNEVIVSNGERSFVVLNNKLQLQVSDRIVNYNTGSAGLVKDANGNVLFVNGTDCLKYDSYQKKFLFRSALGYAPRKIVFSGKEQWLLLGFNSIILNVEAQKVHLQLNYAGQMNLYINQVDVDKEGQLILCTNQGFLIAKKPLSALQEIPPTINQDIGKMETRRALLEITGGKIIQVGYNGINCYDPKTNQNQVWLRKRFLGYAACYLGGQLWVGTDGNGLCRFDIKTKEFAYTNFRPDPKDKASSINISSLCVLSDSTLLIGQYLGRALILYNIRTDRYRYLDVREFPDKEIAPEIRQVTKDKSGRIWIVASDCLYELSSSLNVIHRFRISIFKYAHILMYVEKLSDQRLYVSTDHGVFEFDPQRIKMLRHFDQQSGLSDNQCVAALLDRSRFLWVPTYKGLNCIDLQSSRIRNYYMQDGLPDNEYNHAAHLVSSAGDLYVGGLNGYIRIRPNELLKEEDARPKMVLSNLLLNRGDRDGLLQYDTSVAISLHKSSDLLKIYVGTTDFVSTEYNTFRYRIPGLQNQSIVFNAKEGLLLSRFPKGNYEVLIDAIDSHGKPYDNSIKLMLHTYDFWYESNWFYVLLFTMILFWVVIFFIYRYNAQKKLGNLRASLSNDIHDEVGTLLTKTVMKTELLKMKLDSHTQEIEGIEKNLRDAVHSFRNVLWALNNDLNTIEDLTARVKTNLAYVFENTDFEFIVTQRNIESISLRSPELKRNILYVVKESALNTLKYSNGDLFEVVISHVNGRINLFIADNGKNDISDPLMYGVGLKSIQQRVTRIGGKVFFQKTVKGFFTDIKI